MKRSDKKIASFLLIYVKKQIIIFENIKKIEKNYYFI